MIHTCTRAKDAIGEIFLPPPDEIFFHLHPPVEGPSWGWFCPPLLDNFEFSPKESPFYPPFWIKKSVSSPQIGEKIFSPPWRPKILPPPDDHLLVHVWFWFPIILELLKILVLSKSNHFAIILFSWSRISILWVLFIIADTGAWTTCPPPWHSAVEVTMPASVAEVTKVSQN